MVFHIFSQIDGMGNGLNREVREVNGGREYGCNEQPTGAIGRGAPLRHEDTRIRGSHRFCGLPSDGMVRFYALNLGGDLPCVVGRTIFCPAHGETCSACRVWHGQ